jgi:UDP-N-acetylglucosamine 2-epimerase
MPEELNRVLTDHAASLLLCPSESAAANLRAERVRGEVIVCGT